MYARITTFEGAGADRLDEAIDTNSRGIDAALQSPPEGLEGVKEVWMLVDRDSGKTVDITLFGSEEELQRGHEALSAMSPSDAEGSRKSVGLYEIAFRKQRS